MCKILTHGPNDSMRCDGSRYLYFSMLPPSLIRATRMGEELHGPIHCLPSCSPIPLGTLACNKDHFLYQRPTEIQLIIMAKQRAIGINSVNIGPGALEDYAPIQPQLCRGAATNIMFSVKIAVSVCISVPWE